MTTSSAPDASGHDQDWTSTTELASIAKWLATKNNVLCLTHVKPDGDAVGSTLAVARALNIAGGGTADGFGGVATRAHVVYAAPIPHWLYAVAGETSFSVIEPGQSPPTTMPNGNAPDAIVVLDTGSWNQLAPFESLLKANTPKVAAIDHHLRGDPDVTNRRVVDASWASATMPAGELCRHLLGLESMSQLPPEVAKPCYLGLATDTGWFRHANVSPSALRFAAELLETGIDHAPLLELTEQRERSSRLKLLKRALESLQYHDGERIATIALTIKDYEKSGSSRGESGGFLDIIKTVETVRAAALLTEADPSEDGTPLTKISLRSKPGAGFIDVNRVAAQFGGGGHAMAAGARISATISEARAQLVEVLVEGGG
ncbi:MAG: DHH family phosphoesterase [Planctomycetota bacterium]